MPPRARGAQWRGRLHDPRPATRLTPSSDLRESSLSSSLEGVPMPRRPTAQAALAALFAACSAGAAQTPQRAPVVHRLMPTPTTVAWGYYDAAAVPVLRIRSGDVLVVGSLITSSPD